MQGKASKDAVDKLSSRQYRFVALLLAGTPIATATKEVGVNEVTGHRWLKLPYFQAAYAYMRDALFTDSLENLKARVNLAVDTLVSVMEDVEYHPSARVRAAQIVLEQSVGIHKIAELEAKLAAIEEQLRMQEQDARQRDDRNRWLAAL